MKLLEIINPSDAYTISGEDIDAAILGTIYLGGGSYALKDEAGNSVLPLFLLGGVEEWFEKHRGLSFEAFAGSIPHERVAVALDSVLIGDFHDRRDHERVVQHITDKKELAAEMAKRHDAKRSSLNDIGGRAVQWAERLRTLAKEARP